MVLHGIYSIRPPHKHPVNKEPQFKLYHFFNKNISFCPSRNVSILHMTSTVRMKSRNKAEISIYRSCLIFTFRSVFQ